MQSFQDKAKQNLCVMLGCSWDEVVWDEGKSYPTAVPDYAFQIRSTGARMNTPEIPYVLYSVGDSELNETLMRKAFDYAYELVNSDDYINMTHCLMYYTGLSVVTIGVYQAIISSSIQPIVMSYSKENKCYYPMEAIV